MHLQLKTLVLDGSPFFSIRRCPLVSPVSPHIIVAMGSPVVDEWEKLDYIVALGQKGQLVQYSSRPKVAPGGKNKQIQIFSRRDVVNNADILGPLINHMGT